MENAPVRVVERHVSPDQQLVLIAGIGNDGEKVVGFEGGNWHTHPDLIAYWLGVPESDAIRSFIDRVVRDELPIITSVDRGNTISPWISDNLPATLDSTGRTNCIVRYWSGRPYLD